MIDAPAERKTLTLRTSRDTSGIVPIFTPWIGQEVRVQLKTGTSYTGRIKRVTAGFLVLDAAVIVGKRKKAVVTSVVVHIEEKDLAHVHPVTTEVEARGAK